MPVCIHTYRITDTFAIKLPYDSLFGEAERLLTTYRCLRFS